MRKIQGCRNRLNGVFPRKIKIRQSIFRFNNSVKEYLGFLIVNSPLLIKNILIIDFPIIFIVKEEADFQMFPCMKGSVMLQ